MKVIVPGEFIDNAVYPISVDPTFGFTSIGGSQDALTGEEFDLESAVYSATASGGIGSKVTAYLGASKTSIDFTFAVYNGENLVENSVTETKPPAGSNSWIDFNFVGSPTFEVSTQYRIAIYALKQGGTVVGYIYYDSDANSHSSYGSPCSPEIFCETMTWPQDNSFKYSFYVTYSEVSDTSSVGIGGVKLKGIKVY